MNKILTLIVAVLSLSLIMPDADARRLGGGSSVGKQRSAIAQPAPKIPPQQAPSAAPANPTPQPSGMSKWLGPLAGLAIGAGLASLFMNNGLSGVFGGILMMLLLAAAAIFVVRLLRSRQQPQPLQYAGAGAPDAQPDLSTHFGGNAAVPPVTASRYPPGFDAEQFARHAKLNFTRLQAANDKRDMSTMRDFMTPQLYSEVAAGLEARVATAQQTDVVTLNAEVIEVVTEGESYMASVRFSGMIRERAGAAAEPFSEVWHLEKPVNGDTGWLICGIQQD